jgi:glycine hydroxymethyltransferase
MTNLNLLVKSEEKRQKETIMLIPSENYASEKIREFVGSRLSNKYSEGYSKRRYYQGNYFIDEIEILAIEKARKLFKVPHANVQPYSGSPANSEILFALANYGDKIMGLKLSAGGHLTHGHPDITFSGKYFKSIQFGLDNKGLLNYEKIEELAKKEKPKVMIIGTTAYPLAFDWAKFGKIADSINAYLVADISHVSGLILGGVYPDPVPFAHVLMTTTHKTLRGPRGAMIMVTQKGIKKDSELPSKIDKAVFPGLQGGPHNNTTAGIAQALIEADSAEFRKYAEQIVKNSSSLANYLKEGGLTLVGGKTECHLMVVDLRPLKLSGNIVAEALEVAGIVVNRNSVPFDLMPPFYPSGIRLGTPAVTTRGMKENEMKKIAEWMLKVVDHVKDNKLPNEQEERRIYIKNFKKQVQKDKFLLDISKEVKNFLTKYPIP